MSAEPFLPKRLTLPALREAVQRCRGCPLYADATQAVLRGRAAIGAGRCSSVSSPATRRTGPARHSWDRQDNSSTAHSTKQGSIGKRPTSRTPSSTSSGRREAQRRIHDKPSWSEQLACRPWLDAELAVVEPEVLVLFGATAAQTLLGRSFRVTRDRGRVPQSELAKTVIATIHPSAILRSATATRCSAALLTISLWPAADGGSAQTFTSRPFPAWSKTDSSRATYRRARRPRSAARAVSAQAARRRRWRETVA